MARPAPRPLPADVAPKPTRAEARAAASETLATGVQTLQVEPDEADMRVDRFLVARFPQLAFTHIQRIVRKGELRIDGRRAKPNERLAAGQKIRIPPLKLDQPRPISRAPGKDQDERDFLKSITLYEDKDVLVINKPMGLAVQGGSGTTRHVDGILEALRDDEGAEAASRAPARQGYGRLPCHRQDALCGLHDGEVLPLPLDAQDLLGARRRACRGSGRAASPPTLPRKAMRASRGCGSPSTATRARATR